MNLLKYDKKYENEFAKNTDLWRLYPEKEKNKILKRGTSATTLQTLNVAFHDILGGSSSQGTPLTTAQLDNVLTIVNDFFNGSANGSNGSGSDAMIQFCRATRNNRGDAFQLAYTNTAGASLNSGNLGQMSVLVSLASSTGSTIIADFPSNKFVNIYIVDDIPSTTAGFATLPSTQNSTNPFIDGIYIERAMLNGSNDNTKVLVHELGHYLGLFHVFGICDPFATTNPTATACSCDNGNPLFNGDMVADTPPSKLIAGTCDLTLDTCTAMNAPGLDDKTNYMDYSLQSCQNHFTDGQITRMQFMIDPDDGVRKGLLGNTNCINCQDLDACTFTINATPSLSTITSSSGFGTINTVKKTSASVTPIILFNGTTSCTTTVMYSWSLMSLDNNLTVINAAGANFSTPNNLAAGNYQLQLMASSQSNTNCFETVTYNFTILPHDEPCNVVNPNLAGGWENFTRISFSNGWTRQNAPPYNYVNGSVPHNANTGDPLFAEDGFSIIPLVPGGTLADGNFSALTLPANAGITSVFRIGKTTENISNSAYFAKINVPVNQNNCKYRIWYLGRSEGSGTSAGNFPFTSTQKSASFGVKTLLNYNSGVNTETQVNNSSWGQDENGKYILSATGRPERFIYKPDNYNVTIESGTSTQWFFRDIDFSQFVNLASEANATFTFFAHTNETQGASFQNAYGYFAIECLGGGFPELISYTIPHHSMPCSSPLSANIVQIGVPRAPYFNDSQPFRLDPSFLNFADVDLFKKNSSSGNWEPTGYGLSANADSSEGYVEFPVTATDAPFATYKLVYKTLHQTITNEFRVFVGFYNNLPDCTTGDNINTALYPENYYLPHFMENIDINLFMCTSEIVFPILELTPTCITQPFTYQWYRRAGGGFEIMDGETNASLQLTSSNLARGFIAYSYQRRTIYNEPYCGNRKEKFSAIFTVYSNPVWVDTSPGLVVSDVCFGDEYSLSLNNLLFVNNSLPAAFGFTDTANTLTLQLFADNYTLIGNTQTINFNGQFTQNSLGNNIQFNFNSAGTESIFGPDIFQPKQIGIRISGTYLGCPIDVPQNSISALNFRTSAVGGTIGYNCFNQNITSVNNGNSSGNIYSWEFAVNNGNFNPIVGSATATLTGLQVNNLLASNPNQILRVRRISFGFPQCLANAISNTIIIQPNPPTTITFNNLPAILCSSGSNFVLPTTTSNGIEGTWNPAVIPTQIGAHTLTFTANTGYCLSNITFAYVVNVTNNILPTFNPVASICAGSYAVLPTISTNGISGSWAPNPATTLLTSDTTFTFTPTASACSATTIQIIVNVLPTNTLTFNFPTVLCNTAAAPLLPNQSLEGVTGTWLPNTIDSIASGGYVFTPTAGQCASPTTINVTINSCGFDLVSTVADVGCQSADFTRKYYASVVDSDCMKICEGITITYYIVAPENNSMISSLDWIVSGGTVLSTTSNSCTIQWLNASAASFLVKINLIGGSVVEITRCIEKVNGPTALFSINSNQVAPLYETCTNVAVNFENLSTSSNGNDVLYYNWNFGDGTSSNLFEPSHIYTSDGAYQVVLTVSNGCNCTSQYIANITVKRNNLKIDCPGVVCEGDTNTYTIAGLERCNTINWAVEGGTIAYATTSNEVSVLWDQVTESGFGYLFASSPDCIKCNVLPIKIPVVQQKGVITGDTTMCVKSQGTYKLPQWPSTVYTWTIENNTTDAYLINNETGNEVIVNANSSGEVTLKCTYFNTLLNCGGSAKFSINVTYVAFAGETVACTGNTYSYNAADDYGTTLPNTSWFVTGPNNYLVYGNTGSFTLSFPQAGTYYIAQGVPSASGPNPNDSVPCNIATKVEVNAAQTPTAITGPTVICPGNPITYTCTPPQGATAVWTVLGGTISGTNTASSVVVTFNSLATSFAISVVYKSGTCTSQPYTVTITRDVPQFSIVTPNTSVCGSATETYSTAYANAETYAWSIEPSTVGSIAQGQNSNQVSILWNQPIGATLQATVKLQIRVCGTVYIQNKPITIINHPTIQITGASSACNNQPTTFNFTMNAGTTFNTATWNFGDNTPPEVVTFGNVTNPFSVSHTYASNALTNSTIFPVTLTVSGGNNCTGIGGANYNITVSPTPIVTLNLPTNTSICNSENSQAAAFLASVNIQAGFAGTNTIQWYRNSPAIPAGTTAIINVANVANGFGAGTYYAIVTNSLGCSQNTSTFIITNTNCSGTGNTGDPNNGTCNCTLQGQALISGCGTVSAQITVAGCTPVSTNWSSGIAGATITSNTIYNYQLDNVPFGSHNIVAQVTFINALGETCVRSLTMPFIRPYKADLRYTANCNASNNGYSVTLLDHSVYHPNYPITNHSFSIDGGNSWYTANLVNNIHQYTLPFLPPGVYNMGIKINDGLNGDCTKFITLNLPAAPSSAFTFDQNQCSTEPVHFYATNNAAGLQYRWTLGQTGVINLQPNPVRVYGSLGEYEVTLRVTNALGCYSETTQTVIVNGELLAGAINVNPTNACEGSNMTLTYVPDPNNVMPVNFIWYKDNAVAPFATTSTNSITVSQAGQYFVYVQGSSGCSNYLNKAVTAAFIATPSAPTITGASTVCLGSSATLQVPAAANLTYSWTLDGVAQPQWNNRASINYTPSALGAYIFNVTSGYANAQGIICSSAPAAFTLNCIGLPDEPQIALVATNCQPYSVTATVTNVQAGISYFWSNGTLGTSTTINHDGPLRVRAESLLCSTTNQIVLPRNLNTLDWTFPSGCYTVCKLDTDNQLGYISPPLGIFNNWQWMANTTIVGQGTTSEISNSPQVLPDKTYTLKFGTAQCNKTLGTAAITEITCQTCRLEIYVKDIERAFTDEGLPYYRVVLAFANLSDIPFTGTLTAANGIGYFDPSGIVIPIGESYYEGSFYPLSDYNGGLSTIYFDGFQEKTTCTTVFTAEFPNFNAPRNQAEATTIENTYLYLAPNPAKAYTDVAYNETLTLLQVVDMLGRTIATLPVTQQEGVIRIETASWAAGQYVVLAKNGAQVVKTMKLLISN